MTTRESFRQTRRRAFQLVLGSLAVLALGLVLIAWSAVVTGGVLVMLSVPMFAYAAIRYPRRSRCLHCGERIGWMFSRAPRALFGVTARLRFCPYCGTSLDELREGNPAPAADSAVWNRWTKSHWRILGWSLASAAVILLLLGWIAYPEFRKAKRRSLASHELEELRMLDSAVDQYAIETGRDTGFRMRFEDLKFYLKAGTPLYNTGLDQFGNDYGPFTVDTVPRVPNAAATALSDVASPEFWSPYK